MRLRGTWMVLVGSLLAVAASAENAPADKLISKNYGIADLVGVKDRNQSAHLVEVLTSLVAPATWDEVGGSGKISAVENGKLTVRQTKVVHEQLANLLAALGKLPKPKKNSKPTIHQPIPVAKPGGGAAFSIVVYHVPDIAKKPAGYDALIMHLTTNVSRDSWDVVGGPGSLKGFVPRAGLVIAQTRGAHAQVVRELKKLRQGP